MRAKRLLFVLPAVVATGVGFTGPSEAVTSPVLTMVVDCARSTPTNSLAELGVDVPGGVYVATVVGGCLTHVDDVGQISVSTPCTVGSTAIPCVTAAVSNIPSEACGGSTGALFVGICTPVGGTIVRPTTPCSLSVTVNGACLLLGTTGQVLVGTVGGPPTAVTARFEDSNWSDNTGSFLVTLRPAT